MTIVQRAWLSYITYWRRELHQNKTLEGRIKILKKIEEGESTILSYLWKNFGK